MGVKALKKIATRMYHFRQRKQAFGDYMCLAKRPALASNKPLIRIANARYQRRRVAPYI